MPGLAYFCGFGGTHEIALRLNCMYASDNNTSAELYRLREDLRRIGNRLDKHIEVPDPSAEFRELFRRLSEAEPPQSTTPAKPRAR